MLEARLSAILMDHKPLTFEFQQKGDKCSPRQFNHVDYISKITTDFHHISGQDIIIADARSRVEPITAPVNRDGLAAAQDGDDKLRTLLVCNTVLQLKKLYIPGISIELRSSSGFIVSWLCWRRNSRATLGRLALIQV
jgi:hypothetical protein